MALVENVQHPETPWVYDESLECIVDAKGRVIARACPSVGRYLAAAPELALVVREIVAPLMTHQQLMAAAKAALKKAGLE